MAIPVQDVEPQALKCNRRELEVGRKIKVVRKDGAACGSRP